MFALILIINFILFIVGNIVWTYSIPEIALFGLNIPIFQILISELCFIFLYTMVDKGNIKWGWLFAIFSVFITLQLALPFYGFLFYSTSVQYFSISISVFAIIINSLVIKKLLSKGFSKLFSSRASTSMASLVEISLFAFLLDIGVQGAISTILVRIVYVTLVPKIFFHKQ